MILMFLAHKQTPAYLSLITGYIAIYENKFIKKSTRILSTVCSHFSRGYNFWNNDFRIILKNPTRPYSCLA